MFQLLKRSGLALILLCVGAQPLLGFSISGPFNEAYQVPAIGYNLIATDEGFTDIAAPKNIAQGYRWNTRSLYYAFDANFFNYFGSDGGAAAAIDQAFAVLNSLTNFSAYPADLGDLPLDTRRVNPSAQALGLVDIKSLALSSLVGELGLTQPERYTFTLHNRFLPAGAVCPNYEYLVVQRNFDPVTGLYSPYVNGVLYTYLIDEFCGVTPAPFGRVNAQTFITPVDPDQNADAFSSVADSLQLNAGTFYTGLTRDDIGGLRYLMATNRIDLETVSSDSLLAVTNNSLQLLVTSNLADLVSFTLTNNPAAVLAQFPGIVITSSIQGFSNIVTTNFTAYFTNFNNQPPGTPATLVQVATFATNAIPIFFYTFGNVITNVFFTQGSVSTVTVGTSQCNGCPPGSGLKTNTTVTTTLGNFIGGEYYIIPATAQCGFSIVATQLVTVVPITNLNIIATNAPGTTNVGAQIFSQSIVTYFTNHTLVVSIPQCVAGSIALREGVDKLNFFRRDFDSLLGTFWAPVTNTYTLTAITNNAPFVQTFQRIITAPDFLFTARDFAPGPGTLPGVSDIIRTTPNYVNVTPVNPANGAQPPGPGTIQPNVFFTFNSVGPNIDVAGAFFVTGGEGVTPDSVGSANFLYGSFDGTTNAPVVYPSSLILSNLENQFFLQILLSGPLADGQVGVPYQAQLNVSGYQPPFTWSVAPKSPALPPGINPPTVGADTSVATISGTPTAAGIYDFDLQVQDAIGRVTQRAFTITIDP